MGRDRRILNGILKETVGCSSQSASKGEKEIVVEEHLVSIKESKDELPIDASMIHEENIEEFK